MRAAAAVSLAVAAVALGSTPTRAGDTAPPRFAVVELFTSEGCSSCPPADKLLGDLASQARTEGRAIYFLAFHVDYWDQLGWKDPFSSASYSSRQSAYARAMHSQRIYTPQMIVNGTEELVGSDRSRAVHAIDAALARASGAKVTLQILAGDPWPQGSGPTATGTAATVRFSVAGGATSCVLHVAAIEGGLVSSVSRGENSGRVLRHENVVRSFVTLPLSSGHDGTLTLALPPGATADNTSIVGYVQDPSTMAILGAAAVTIR